MKTATKPTHHEFVTKAFVSLPLDDVMDRFMNEDEKPLYFRLCNSGSGPVGEPNERFYVALGRDLHSEVRRYLS